MLFVSIACSYMLIPSYAAIEIEFNIPIPLIAISDSFFVLISAFFALVWGYYSDRINRAKVLLAGSFSWTIGMLITAFSSTYLMLLISRVLSGAGLGCVLPVGYSIISDTIPPEERSSWFGALAILSSVSNGIGQGLSAFLRPILTWRFPFLLLSGISIGIMIFLFFVKIPQRGASEDALRDLTELNLEYSYIISKEDLRKIIRKKTNIHLIVQAFFSVVPGTILIFFLTSMLENNYFNQLPIELRPQTSTIFAGMVGIGYIFGVLIFSKLGDLMFNRNRKNRARLATVCMFLTIPFYLLMLYSLQPIEVNMLDITYPDPIPTAEIGYYVISTISSIFKAYPSYIYTFIFALIASMLGAGPVANRIAIMIDVNLPEHKGTASSFFKLSDQVGKGLTLLSAFTIISLLGSMFNSMVFSVFFWVPAGILWIFANRSVVNDMSEKTRMLSERQQLTVIDFIFELEIQMDRAYQKVQDAKFYILVDQEKFKKLLKDAEIIFTFCEREGEFRSITNIQESAHIMYLRTNSIRHEVIKIYKKLENEDLSAIEIDRLNEDLRQIRLRISEFPKSTYQTIQTYYEVAHLNIVEARLMRNYNLIKCLDKIKDAIVIYHRVRNLLKERIENFEGKSEVNDEDKITNEKERDLFEKCNNALNATIKLKDELEAILNELVEHGIQKEDLSKFSDLMFEYQVNLYSVIEDTFGEDKATIKNIKQILNKISGIFNEYDKWKETDFTVF